MKHSKLPWFISKCALHQGHYDIISPTRLVTCVKGDNKKDAAFIVTACNAHDTLKAEIGSCVMLNEALMEENTRLKAKAELLDEATELLNLLYVFLITNIDMGVHIKKDVNSLLSKAKELK